MEHKFCPGCENHCPLDALKCGKGRNFFGVKDDREHRHDRPRRSDPRAIELMIRCGKFLHHGVPQDADTSELLKALNPEEISMLEKLLEKCLQAWQTEQKA